MSPSQHLDKIILKVVKKLSHTEINATRDPSRIRLLQKVDAVPVKASITVSCKANLGILNHRMTMAFTPDAERNCLPEGISISGSAVLIKSGTGKKISVLIVNKT